MEDTLRVFQGRQNDYCQGVLILVLMEDTLRACSMIEKTFSLTCLNPCFNGRYSQSVGIALLTASHKVLILVLMEDTLRVFVLL